MPTNVEVYKPPHMRDGYSSVFPLNNNSLKYEDNNAKVFKPHDTMSKILHNMTSSKAYIPPAMRHPMNGHQGKINNNESNSISTYKDRQFKGSSTDYKKKLEESTTVYVGCLNLLSSESDIHKLFSSAGKIKKIIMGIDNETSGPGGFCFIEYETRLGAETCMKTMTKAMLDGKQVKVDWDAGFIEGRQYRREKAKKRFSFAAIYPPMK
ncbi:nuclear cap-binding protein subunit 2-like [Adelges cooleyi]|uniref:nuclear cap-binding protein subunit 2-like n=1 Tax=Adelges cooleyi TaxID=133065 RepID=UPI002180060C|nr:nuclear cap-binding protein subunit 2-like [Adelges cooleyi]XP_050438700.1 nuclear cap-binding protein subunit 2-like [Adelges cooleyi]